MLTQRAPLAIITLRKPRPNERDRDSPSTIKWNRYYAMPNSSFQDAIFVLFIVKNERDSPITAQQYKFIQSS